MTVPGVIISGPQSRGALVTWSPRRPTLQSFILFHWLGSHVFFAILGHSTPSRGEEGAWLRAVKRVATLSSQTEKLTTSCSQCPM